MSVPVLMSHMPGARLALTAGVPPDEWTPVDHVKLVEALDQAANFMKKWAMTGDLAAVEREAPKVVEFLTGILVGVQARRAHRERLPREGEGSYDGPLTPVHPDHLIHALATAIALSRRITQLHGHPHGPLWAAEETRCLIAGVVQAIVSAVEAFAAPETAGQQAHQQEAHQ